MAEAPLNLAQVANALTADNTLSDTEKAGQLFAAIPAGIGSTMIRKILAANQLKFRNGWTDRRAMSAIGIGHDAWYRWQKRDEFRVASIEFARFLLANSGPKLVESLTASALFGDSRAAIRILEEIGVLKPQAGAVASSSISINLGVNILTAPSNERQAFREGYAAAYQRGKFSNN
jgi:hypothetical protein